MTAASATPAIARSPPTPASAQSPSNQAKANTHSSTGRAATASRRIRQARRLKPPAQPLGRRHLQPSPGQERQPPPRRSRPRARVVPGHLVPVVRPRHLQPRQANRATQTDRRGRLTIVGPPGRPHSPPATAGAAVAVGCRRAERPSQRGEFCRYPIVNKEPRHACRGVVKIAHARGRRSFGRKCRSFTERCDPFSPASRTAMPRILCPAARPATAIKL